MALRISIVGVGSDAGDDAAGWQVIAGLEQALAGSTGQDDIAVAVCRHPAVDLMGRLQGAASVILIDAVSADLAPGTVLRLEGEEVLGAASTLSTHGIDLPSILRLAASLGELPGALSLYGIVAGHAEPGRPMSAVVSAAVDRVVERILEDICHRT